MFSFVCFLKFGNFDSNSKVYCVMVSSKGTSINALLAICKGDLVTSCYIWLLLNSWMSLRNKLHWLQVIDVNGLVLISSTIHPVLQFQVPVHDVVRVQVVDRLQHLAHHISCSLLTVHLRAKCAELLTGNSLSYGQCHLSRSMGVLICLMAYGL